MGRSRNPVNRYFGTFIVFTLVLGVGTHAAFSAVNAGTACTTYGKTTTQSGLKFECVKSGKKLKWVLVGKVNSSGIQTAPATAPQPSAPQPKTTQPTSSQPTAAPKKPISSASEFAVITDKLIKEVWARTKSTSHEYKVFIEPGYEKAPYAIESSKLIQATIDFTAALGAPPLTPTRIYMPYNWSWVQSYIDRNVYCYDASWAGGLYCGNGLLLQNLAHFKNWIPTGLEPIPDQPVGQALIRQLSHEFAHQSQGDLLSKYQRNQSFFPAWLREGGPEIISMAAYMKVYNMSYLEVRDLYLNFSSPFCRRVKMNDLLMSGNHPDDCQGVNGVLASEALIATTGNLESLFTFSTSKIAGNGPRFDVERQGISNETYKSVMQEIYGINVDTWHPIVEAEFVKWATCSRSSGDIQGCYFIRG